MRQRKDNPFPRINSEHLVCAIRELNTGRQIRIMEVCGTHTMAIAKSGIKSLLPENIKLLSGPGCPVCVTPAGDLDRILSLAMRKKVIVTTYGDMVRVPGSTPGDSLLRRRALGADVRVIYSPTDALEIARQNPEREIVFLGVGFETTAPGTAAALLSAREERIQNFSIFSLLKSVEPAMRKLISSENFMVDGFLCPGHVAAIIGEKGFEFLPGEYDIPSVIAGFEPEDILSAIYRLLIQILENRGELENEYSRVVSENGNRAAQEIIKKCFVLRGDNWRGLGYIPDSGFGIAPDLREYDAEIRFEIGSSADENKRDTESGCRCGDVITGRAEPAECPFFGKRCVPEDPVGPCMVSGEGACAAAYKYMDIKWMK